MLLDQNLPQGENCAKEDRIRIQNDKEEKTRG
jgi:hypothetical protein